MSLLLIVLLAGWFVLTDPGESLANQEPPKSEEATVVDKQWKTRLLALQEGGNWFAGAQVGMELMRIPGDKPYHLLKDNWADIATSAKKQILKGFSPGMMGNKKMHPRFFDVMHLGMTDPDKGVREYAATYLEMQGLPNFKGRENFYTRWWEKNKELSVREILADKKIELIGESAADQQAPSSFEKQWKARLLALEEGGSWYDGAKVGMELMNIPGDEPYIVLQENWANIATSAKKQILKGFSPGMMGNTKMHPRFFDVMHLGMTDPDKGVREYAAAYIEMQGLPNFKGKDRVYARWWVKNKGRSAKEIVGKKDLEIVGESKDTAKSQPAAVK